MLKITQAILAVALTGLVGAADVQGQHLFWNLEEQKGATCLYGEVTVLATHPAIYYCGANWHPGEPAGGYCGIQHNSQKERRTIFSIWDTSDKLHPQVTAADSRTIFNRFGGEGEGAHTHMLWPWQAGDSFQFYVRKDPGLAPETTDTRYYVYDRAQQKWLHSATINNPNGGHKSVTTFGGGLNSFLENFAGRDKSVPKLALYRLWLGTEVNNLKCLTRAAGDGTWGELHDAYFLAEGDRQDLDQVFSQFEKEDYGKPLFGEKGKALAPISNRPLKADLLDALKDLPQARAVEAK